MHRAIPLELRLVVLTSALLAGCVLVEPMQDQAQVDPVVTEVPDRQGRNPKSAIVTCSVAEWIARASYGSACGRSEAAPRLTKSLVVSDGVVYTVDPNSITIAQALSLRNSAQAELMTMSDLSCKSHLAGIYGTQSGLNFSSSWFAAMLSGAAAITTDRSARNLAAGSAFLSTTRGLINSEIYYSYIAPAVIAEIELNRQRYRAAVQRKRSCGIDVYPPAEAVNDALNYHETCSFISGLTSLLRKAGLEQRAGDPIAQASRRNLKNQVAALLASETTLKEKLDKAPDSEKPALRAALEDRQALRRQTETLLAMLGEAEPAVERYNPASRERRLVLEAEILAADKKLAELRKDADKNKAAIAEWEAKRKLDQELLKKLSEIAGSPEEGLEPTACATPVRPDP